MRIMFINHYAGSLFHGQDLRPYMFAREWKRAGHDVLVVASSESHVRHIRPSAPRLFTPETVGGIPYLWIKTPPYRKNGVRRAVNIIAFVSLLSAYSRRLASAFRPDIVICASTYPLDNVPGHMIAKYSGARLIFELHDLWPLTLIELANMSRRNPFIALLQWGEDFACRHAHKIVSVLPGAREHLEQHGMKKGNFIHIPIGIDINEWQSDSLPVPDEHARVMESLRRRGQFILGYAGSHGVGDALEWLVESADILRLDPVSLVLVGKGTEKQRLRSLTQTRNLHNVIFLPQIPKASIPDFLSRVDATYLGWQARPIYRFGISPNKLIDYMMAGKPIIHSTATPYDPVCVARCGISAPPEEPARIAEAIRSMASLDESQRVEMGRCGRQYVEKYHNIKELADRMILECAN